jgi:hypothetical protein
MKNYAVPALLLVIILGGAYFLLNKPTEAPPLGATPGNDFFGQVNFLGGVLNSGSVATTSQGSVTVTAAEIKQWANASAVSYSPGLVAGATLTFPASSTLSSFLPKPGDSAKFCVRNATSTTNVPVTFAGGSGTNLLVASSSATAVGSTKLFTGKVGCFTAVRQVATATTYDIDFLFTAFQ